MNMFNDTFREVLTHNGVVSVTSWAENNAHVANTWNDFLVIKDDNKLLIPAAGFNETEKNVNKNSRVIVTLGSPEVEGTIGMGTGFVIDGTATFLTAGEDFEIMKEKFSFLTRVMEITAASVTQTI
jgi:hypothetical protein